MKILPNYWQTIRIHGEYEDSFYSVHFLLNILRQRWIYRNFYKTLYLTSLQKKSDLPKIELIRFLGRSTIGNASIKAKLPTILGFRNYDYFC